MNNNPKPKRKQETVPSEFTYPIFHLKNFSVLDRATGLYGEQYQPVLKSLWYVVYGQTMKDRIVSLGGVETDCRMNTAFVLPSGYGKKNIEDALTRACSGLEEKVVMPTSCHPEQLIGKTRRIKKYGQVIYEHDKGHLGEDLIVFDDAVDLIRGTGAYYRESRRYLITALDTVGKNLITKRAVDIPREDMLSYYSHCTVIVFFQPFSFPEEVVLTGLSRRFLFQFPEFSDNRREEFLHKVERAAVSQSRAMDALILDLRKLTDDIKKSSTQKLLLKFTDEAVARFKELHLLLIEYGKSFSPKVSNFTEMIAFTLQNWLLKMIAILTKSRGKPKVGVFEVEMAFIGLLEFMNSNCRFVEIKVRGSLDYGEWNGVSDNDLSMLSWLQERNALSEKTSSISIGDYIKRISDVFGIGAHAARKKYQKHKTKGWIKGKQTGQYKTAVFLTRSLPPREQGDKGERVIRQYKEIIDRNLLLSTPSDSHERGRGVSPELNFPHTQGPLRATERGRVPKILKRAVRCESKL